MSNNLWLGLGRYLLPIPALIWQRQINQMAHQTRVGLSFMSADHRRVRDFVVRELPIAGQPLSPETIAQSVSLSLDRVNALLDDLEKRMTFLFRDGAGQVVWAYPVTAAQTPHHFVASTGESLYSA